MATSNILNPNFLWNIVILIGIGAIVVYKLLGGVKTADVVGLDGRGEKRVALLWIGLLMVAFSIGFIMLSNWEGVFSPVPEGQVPKEPEQGVSIQLLRAHATLAQVPFVKSDVKPIATIEVVELHEARVPKRLGDDLVVYVGKISLLGRTRLVAYRSSTPPSPNEISDDVLKAKLEKSEVLWDVMIWDKRPVDFGLNGNDYTAVADFRWFLIGPGYAVINVYPRLVIQK